MPIPQDVSFDLLTGVCQLSLLSSISFPLSKYLLWGGTCPSNFPFIHLFIFECSYIFLFYPISYPFIIVLIVMLKINFDVPDWASRTPFKLVSVFF